MSTPTPIPAAPAIPATWHGFWAALAKTLAHDDLPLAVGPFDAALAAVEVADAVNPDPVALAKTAAQLQLDLIVAAPRLAATTFRDLAGAIRQQLARIPATPATPAT
jgi:hypothetical protein